MSQDRRIIFQNIKSALDGVDKVARPQIDFSILVAEGKIDQADPWLDFKKTFESVRGVFCDSVEDLVAFIKNQNLTQGYCDPGLKECLGDPLSAYFTIEYEYPRERVNDLSFAITCGSHVIAETGTIVLKDHDSVNRLATVAPWLHIAAVETPNIHPTVRDALLAFGDDPNIVWVTGPSKTGDIEGILIEGVHGPGEQVCFRI
jgi:L-lactate dehydrogenase complex protein LldG